MGHLLFVCTGNICRSPFAERYATLLADRSGHPDWTFASAGIGALVGQPMDPPMARELRERGGDDGGFVARQLDFRMIREADWIVTLEDHHRLWILEEFPARLKSTMSLGRLAAVAAELDPEVTGEEFLRVVGGIRRAADPAHDIPDPYRRGDAAATAAADRIARAIDDVVGRLLAEGPDSA